MGRGSVWVPTGSVGVARATCGSGEWRDGSAEGGSPESEVRTEGSAGGFVLSRGSGLAGRGSAGGTRLAGGKGLRHGGAACAGPGGARADPPADESGAA